MNATTTLLLCPGCRSTCNETDRFCPSCGSHQGHADSGKSAGGNSNRGVLLVDPPSAQQSELPISNQVGYATHLNVTPQQGPAYTPPSQTINVNVSTPGMAMPQEEDSYTFAILTFVAYLFIFPVGAIMNLIGLLCGPKRGCFAAMFFLILVPTVCLSIGLFVLAIIASAAGA